MDLQEASIEIINFLATKAYSKVLCVGTAEYNEELKRKFLICLDASAVSEEFVVNKKKNMVIQRNNRYEWFCRFINLDYYASKVEHIESITGYSATHILFIVNNVHTTFQHVYDVADMYNTKGNKVIILNGLNRKKT